MEFTGRITKEGKWVGFPDIRSYASKRYAGKSISVLIAEIRPKASSEAYGYYHAIILPAIVWAMADLGNDINPYDKKEVDTVHRYLCNTLLKNGRILSDKNGEEIRTDSSLAGVDQDQMMQFETDCIVWAAEHLHIEIPPPDKEWKKKGQTRFIFTLEESYPEVVKRYKKRRA